MPMTLSLPLRARRRCRGGSGYGFLLLLRNYRYRYYNTGGGCGIIERRSLSTSATTSKPTSSKSLLPLYRRYGGGGGGIRILYASQGGTAHLFARQLFEELTERFENDLDEEEDTVSVDVSVSELNDCTPEEMTASAPAKDKDGGEDAGDDQGGVVGRTLYVVVASTAGVGEPPDNGRQFYRRLLELASSTTEAATATSTTEAAATTTTIGEGEGVVSSSRAVVAAAAAKSSNDLAVFGLGNRKAHPNHYNAFARSLFDLLLQVRLGDGGRMVPIVPLGLGDDGDCIEDDFDRWQEQLLRVLFELRNEDKDEVAVSSRQHEEKEDGATFKRRGSVVADQLPPCPFAAGDGDDDGTATGVVPADSVDNDDWNDESTRVAVVDPSAGAALTAPCPAATKTPCGTRRISARYPMLALEEPAGAPATTAERTHLLDDAPQLYAEGSRLWNVRSNRSMNADPVASGLWEIRLEPAGAVGGNNDNNPTIRYEAGDHLLVSARNSDCLVESYLEYVVDDVDPHATMSGIVDPTLLGADIKKYPYPFRLTVYETLSHCVDLGATPSPKWCKRWLAGHNADLYRKMDYKSDIALPRRTMIDLLCEFGNAKLSLEDFLYTSAPLQGRYYSIASSQLIHPNTIFLTYRPVKYVNSKGMLREGTCTSFLSHLNDNSQIVAAVRSNPTFRLPDDHALPVVLLAGGCGVAPIRAFLEHRIATIRQTQQHQQQQLPDGNGVNNGGFGECVLFLGFRNPADEVYRDLVDEAVEVGAVTSVHVMYNSGCADPGKCGFVSDAVRRNGKRVHDVIEKGGYLYVCGGARAFGVAIERELHSILETHGSMSEEDATNALRDLSRTGRLNEDLAD